MIICAIHCISESFDHYNFCLKGKDVKSIVDQVCKSLGSEMEYCSQFYVSVLGERSEVESEIRDGLCEKGSQS